MRPIYRYNSHYQFTRIWILVGKGFNKKKLHFLTRFNRSRSFPIGSNTLTWKITILPTHFDSFSWKISRNHWKMLHFHTRLIRSRFFQFEKIPRREKSQFSRPVLTNFYQNSVKFFRKICILTLGSFDSASFNSKKHLNVEMDLVCQHFDRFASHYHEIW